MEINVLIAVVVLLILSAIAVFAYILKNKAIYPDKHNEMDEDEAIFKTFIYVMGIAFVILVVIISLLLFDYLRIVL